MPSLDVSSACMGRPTILACFWRDLPTVGLRVARWTSCHLCARVWGQHWALPEEHTCASSVIQGKPCLNACLLFTSGSWPPLTATHALQVYAIDLLGFGRSDKPLLDYSTELWRDQLMDFMSEFVDAPAVLVGNSIGSLVSLMVSPAHVHSVYYVGSCAHMRVLKHADQMRSHVLSSHAVQANAKSSEDVVRGTVLLNCAGGMNTKVRLMASFLEMAHSALQQQE